MQIRTLGAGEHDAWLALLDGWELADGWRGLDYFQRPLERDPTFDDANVWVAEADGRLVSTVQVFPRRLQVRGAAIPTGGIGSVYTRDDARGKGVASRLLERAVRDMRERGMELSLLFAARMPFYRHLGWHCWPMQRELLRPGAGFAPPEAAAARPFEAARDLEEVAQLHARAARRLAGVATRSPAEWRASLALGGNPEEEFLVARTAGGLRAYLRAIRLNAALLIAEYGAEDADALAGLCARVLVPRADDPLASAERPSSELRSWAVLSVAAPPDLAAALGRLGIARQPVEDPTVMLRCLDAAALGRRLDGAPAPGEAGEAFLARMLPPGEFAFWPADRF